MKRHSIEPRDHIFVTGYENLYFAKNTKIQLKLLVKV